MPRVSHPVSAPCPTARIARVLGAWWLASWVVGLAAVAHPTGTMVLADGTLLWSYVCPVDTPQHQACVMSLDTRDEGARPQVWVASERSASDWLISRTDGDTVLLVERAYDGARDVHRVRVLEGTPPHAPHVIRDWFDDDHRFGEAGFARLPGGELLFARYPGLYVLHEGGRVTPWDAWSHETAELEYLPPDRLLVRSDGEAWLLTLAGEPVRHWPELLASPTRPLPFMGNRVFDVAYDGNDASGTLWLAYWGQRRFDAITADQRTTAHDVDAPFLPHAVASGDGHAYLLASSLDPGTEIRPRLWRWDGSRATLIWGDP